MPPFVVVPTRNESANVEPLIRELFALPVADLHVLVVDDDSPDGTSRIVAGLCAEFARLRLLTRVGLKGRGSAGVHGLQFALQLGADTAVEMDADFSHPPSLIPRLLAGLADADITIASRLAPGAQDTRPASRRAITQAANLYARAFLQRRGHASRVRDWTSGFRAYRREALERIGLATLTAQGPSILQEMLYRALQEGCIAHEIPFTMHDRRAGTSTFSRNIAMQSLASIPGFRRGKTDSAEPSGPVPLATTDSPNRTFRLERKS